MRHSDVSPKTEAGLPAAFLFFLFLQEELANPSPPAADHCHQHRTALPDASLPDENYKISFCPPQKEGHPGPLSWKPVLRCDPRREAAAVGRGSLGRLLRGRPWSEAADGALPAGGGRQAGSWAEGGLAAGRGGGGGGGAPAKPASGPFLFPLFLTGRAPRRVLRRQGAALGRARLG